MNGRPVNGGGPWRCAAAGPARACVNRIQLAAFGAKLCQVIDKLGLVSLLRNVEGGVIVVVAGIDIRASLDCKQCMAEASLRRGSEQAHIDFVGDCPLKVQVLLFANFIIKPMSVIVRVVRVRYMFVQQANKMKVRY